MLQTQQLSYSVAKKTILQQVDFHVNPHEFVVIVGPNGAGKSTLLQLLAGDIQPSHGNVLLNNAPLSQYSASELAKIRAVLTQQYDLAFPFSVQEVVEMAFYAHQDCPPNALMQHKQHALELMQVAHLSERDFTRLSGGEKQRVQLARVFTQLLPTLSAKKPAYLLIDEPTSSLDIFHQYQVMEQAKTLANQGAAVIAVVHDLALAASFADRIYVLKDGKVAVQGNPFDALQAQHLNSVYGVNAHISQIAKQYPHLSMYN